MMNMIAKLKRRPQTGASSSVCISLSHLLPMRARSRASDQVRREAVCWAPIRAKTAAQHKSPTNTVAADDDFVA